MARQSPPYIEEAPPDREDVLTAALLEGLPALAALAAWGLIVAWAITWRPEQPTDGLLLMGLLLGILSLPRGLGWRHIDHIETAALAFFSQFVFMTGWFVALLANLAATECMGCSGRDGREEMAFVWLFAIILIVSPLASAAILVATHREALSSAIAQG